MKERAPLAKQVHSDLQLTTGRPAEPTSNARTQRQAPGVLQPYARRGSINAKDGAHTLATARHGVRQKPGSLSRHRAATILSKSPRARTQLAQ